MSKYTMRNGKFVIADFDTALTFSNFMPAIAGTNGIPLWNFYVNRGQCIAGFGTTDKGSPIMEFCPASIAMTRVPWSGFRTFLLLDGRPVEPFGAVRPGEKRPARTMTIGTGSFSINERNTRMGFEVNVDYCGVPEQPFAALARRVRLTNISRHPMTCQIADGLVELLPIGISNSSYKEVGNLMRSFMAVEQLERRIPLYQTKSATFDSTQMQKVQSANFYLAFADDGQLLAPVVDPDIIFGRDTSYAVPVEYYQNGVDQTLARQQYTEDKVACGFGLLQRTLEPGQSVTIHTMIGNIADVEYLHTRSDILSAAFFEQCLDVQARLIAQLVDDIDTHTAQPLFDEYLKQSYLDNILRGGYPMNVDGHPYYVYSRKHGDLERDYNWFVLSPSYYSNGEGNFRDVAQNRRNDIFFHPWLGDANIHQFFDLVQLDGFNPLVVAPPKFQLLDDTDVTALVSSVTTNATAATALTQLLAGQFSLGQLVMLLERHGVDVPSARPVILGASKLIAGAKFGEGYWVDHFGYLVDMLESFLDIFPDRLLELFYGKNDYRYFHPVAQVLPRNRRQVLCDDGVHRVNSLVEVHPKQMWSVDKRGRLIQVNLASKMLALIVNKAASLDNQNLGIDMEANKPGWNDAMNGVPALFGSSVPELIELVRLVDMLQRLCAVSTRDIKVLAEQADFFVELHQLLRRDPSAFEYYQVANDIKERYRQRVYDGVSGKMTSLPIGDIADFATRLDARLHQGLQQASAVGGGLLPTFVTYRATKYHLTGEANCVEVDEFERRCLPLFAEAPARSFKISGIDHRAVYQAVRKSDLYDRTLGVYKTSVSLEDETIQIGRIRVFSAGWLERETCFLHMGYKYIYGLLCAGLYDEFFDELGTNLVAFMDPERYGRSPLENSSFIVTDVKSDPKLVGRGFQPRLTGANAEVISMWKEIFLGKNPFECVDRKLVFAPKPRIHSRFFDRRGQVSTVLFGRTRLVYRNPSHNTTYLPGVQIRSITLKQGTSTRRVTGDRVVGKLAENIRAGLYDEIVIQY